MDNSSVHESRWESKLDSHYRCWKPQVFTLSVFVSTKAWACDQGSNNQMYLSQILIWELEVPRSREILSWWWAVATMLSETLDALLRLRCPSSVPGAAMAFSPTDFVPSFAVVLAAARTPCSWASLFYELPGCFESYPPSSQQKTYLPNSAKGFVGFF